MSSLPKTSTQLPYRRDPEPGRTRSRVRELTAMGLKPRAISLAIGISTQAVYQHIDRLRELGELEEATA